MAWPQVECVDLARLFATEEGRAQWDELFARSACTLPTAQAAHLLNWQRHFAPRAPLIGLIVREKDDWRAALPLVAAWQKRVLPVWRLPWNEWGWAGELLLDWAAADLPAVMDQLVLGLRSLNRPWVWFDAVPLNNPAWQQFIAALARREIYFHNSHRFDIGTINIHGLDAPANFAAYQAAWSGNFRRQMRKTNRRADELGGVELNLIRPHSREEALAELQRGLLIEDSGWKGAAGTSILRHPAKLRYYQDQAALLAMAGQLELAFLEHQGRTIAFEYAYTCKGVYYTPKVAYDEAFQHLSPGQLIRYHLLERFFNEPERRVFDFLGPLADATAKWITGSYPIHRLIVSTGRWGGDALLRAATTLAPRMKDWTGRLTTLLRGKNCVQPVNSGEEADQPQITVPQPVASFSSPR
ncbi:MAG: GNAT family N-acetyltransferase [Pirellulales bacterium]|nr:GNAT family N-acetyltransferase [Pirellulales bacterium]